MFRLRSIAAIAGLIFVALVAIAPMASAQTDGRYPLNEETQPTVLERGATQQSPAAVSPAVAAQGQSLPVTGGDVVGLVVIGLVAVGAGFALVRYQRSSASSV